MEIVLETQTLHLAHGKISLSDLAFMSFEPFITCPSIPQAELIRAYVTRDLILISKLHAEI